MADDPDHVSVNAWRAKAKTEAAELRDWAGRVAECAAPFAPPRIVTATLAAVADAIEAEAEWGRAEIDQVLAVRSMATGADTVSVARHLRGLASDAALHVHALMEFRDEMDNRTDDLRN